MKNIFVSIVSGVVIGICVYIYSLLFGASDAKFFGIEIVFSVTCLRVFSPCCNVRDGLNSLIVLDWFVVIVLTIIMLIATNSEMFFIRIVESACFGVFFLAVSVSVRNPIYLFSKRKPNK